MDLQLAGDGVVVVGGARGLGQAIAAAFVAEGAHVALWDIAPEVAQTARQLATGGAVVTAQTLDVTDGAAVAAAAEQARSRLGPIRHVVFAVGLGSGKFGFPFWNLQPGDWERVLRVNLLGAVNVAHTFAPVLAAARQGTLLFLSSVAGQIGSQSDPPYSAAKAALLNFAQCAARDLAPYGVRVNTICPGMVQTVLNRAVWQAWADRQPPEQRQSYEAWTAAKIQRVVPLNRWQTPEDIAAAAVFLASPCAQNITGQALNVDGGWVMHS